MNKPITGIDLSGCVDFYPKGNEHIQKLEDLGWDKQSIDKANTPQPKREWVGLTDEEINSVRYKRDWTAPWTDTTFARAIEAKLKEKNT